MNEKLIEKLKTLAAKKAACEHEDFSIYDYSGGNFDDAYRIGCQDGEIGLAQEILNEFFPEVKLN